jgi:hypothetical protein
LTTNQGQGELGVLPKTLQDAIFEDPSLGVVQAQDFIQDFSSECYLPFEGQEFSLGHAPSETERGFVATNLHPFNLNDWDFNQNGAPGRRAPYDSDPDAQGTTGKRRRKRNKCLGSSKTDPNFILGDDLTMVEVSPMADKTLVRKAYGDNSLKKLCEPRPLQTGA